ncbi:MAG: HlyD family efflux transporter periplasmic adaptor subunit [Pseudomonadota bacterium]|nr:HlyD family efflux transporter periplasmic adaptor subunit [Pseudomonadota bacterium]
MPESPSPDSQKTSLFRQQAIDAQQTSSLGRIVLIRPFSFTVITTVSVILGLLLVALFYFGNYTRRTSVTGQLMPIQGLVRVFPIQTGIVIERNAQEGQSVQRGDVLYVISSERTGSQGQAVQAQISQQVTERAQSLQIEIEKTRHVHRDEQTQQQNRVASLQRELGQLDYLIDEQQRRVSLSKKAVERYQSLSRQGFASQEQLQQQQEQLLDQNSRLQALQRERTTLSSELQRQQNELDMLPLRQQSLIAQLDRILTQTEQELTESEARRTLRVLAPESGVATNILAEVGQVADPMRPMLAIVPKDSALEAQLYVPSQAMGFVREGQTVMLRYQAFPYQKFGQARGIVSNISRTALSPAEYASNGLVLSQALQASNEPVYRIQVTLDQQSITAYGQAKPLQAGMVLEADILQERRRLYEWILEPLYTISGRF